MRRAFFPALLVVLALAWPSFAAAERPYDLYAAGRYTDAIRAGVAEQDATGFAIAARATLADATTREEPCVPCLERAEGFARSAVHADPSFPDGETYLAVSLGYEARLAGPVFARLHNYPGQAKRALDAALKADPKNFWALAALGGWNVEIVRTGGPFLADYFYSASVEKGQEAFAQAFRIAPHNVAIRYQYALSLSGYDLPRFRPEIEDALAHAAHDAPLTSYERLTQSRATELASLLRRGDTTAFEKRVRKYQGYR
jgi:hypothetical protein